MSNPLLEVRGQCKILKFQRNLQFMPSFISKNILTTKLVYEHTRSQKSLFEINREKTEFTAQNFVFYWTARSVEFCELTPFLVLRWAFEKSTLLWM